MINFHNNRILLLSLVQLLGTDVSLQANEMVNVGCKIYTSHEENGTRVEALISGAGPVAGTYVFVIHSHDSSTPLRSEEGAFKIESSVPTVLKKAALTLPAGKAYNASLRVVWRNGVSSCSASVS